IATTASTPEKSPTNPYPVIRPLALSPRIEPLTRAPSPDAKFCTEELMLMNPLRNSRRTLEVNRAMAGTIRPDMQTMQRVVELIAAVTETGGKFVIKKIEPIEANAM